MSHQDVAAIWSTLQGRLDIDNIVQELIGQYYLKASQHRKDRALLRACAFDHTVALRTIFDLQRTYLQSSELSFESRSSLLHPSILFSTISHLLEVKASAISTLDGFTDHDAYCSFIGQTFLSGLRALLLQKRDFLSTEHEDFVLRFDEVWGCETLRDVDHFVINLLCRRIIAELSSPDNETQYSKAACGTVKLRDLCQDQYPNEEHSDAVVQAARDSLAGTRNSADWFEGALIAYDTFWSTTAALIKLCVDVESKKRSDQSSFAEVAGRLNHVHLILVPRLKMLEDLYQISSSQSSRGTLEWAKEQVKTMVCLSIRPSCFSHECTCFGEDRPVVHKMWLQHGGRKVLSVIHSHTSQVEHLEVEGTLKVLQLTLDVRNDTLPDLSKELRFISRKLAHYSQEWCPNPGSSGSSKPGSSTEDVFVINCPDLHPMVAKNLLSQLNSESSRRKQQAPAFLNDIRLLKDVPSRISCDHCSWQSSAISARRIEPLSRLSEYITERLKSQREMVRVRLDLLSKAPAGSVRTVHTPHIVVNSGSSTIASVKPRNRVQERNKLYRTPGVHNLRPTNDDIRPASEHSHTSSPKQRVSRINVSSSEALTRSPSLRKVPSIATTYVSSTSSTAVHTSQLSSSSSRTFSPPLLPSQFECTTLPEVVEHIEPKRSSAMSIRSDQSPRSQDKKSVWSLFRSGYVPLTASSTPSAAFFSSGKTLLIWNSLGAVCYEVENMASISFRTVAICDVLIAAGGMRKCAVVSKTGASIILRIFLGTNPIPNFELELEGVPFRIAVSRNDQYVALKYGSYVRVFDTVSGVIFSHKLPTLGGRSGPKDHLIAFSNDCLSFVASTRCEPEKVVTFTAACQDSSNGNSVESSAPYGLVGDDGLSSIVISDHSAFLTTYTEKGYPMHLSLSETRPSVRPLRDKGQHVGSRVHRAVLCPAGENLVLMNDRNEIFWISTPFGREQAPMRVASIKRARSVRREVEMAIPGRDEVHVFWIEKGKGVLVTVGRNGGRSKLAELNVNIEQLLEG